MSDHPEVTRSGVLGTCDVCGKPAIDRFTGEGYQVEFCKTCGHDLTLFQVVEHKYGYGKAQRLFLV